VATIRSNGLWLHFEQDGDPAWPTVLLVHGFASSGDDNWLATGWVKRLHEAKRRTVRVDCRGHGRSEKPHDPAAYSLDLFAADLDEVLRYANARSVDLFGYSMGARLSLHFMARRASRLRSVVLGGIGGSVVRGLRDSEAIAAALEARDPSQIASPVGRAFREGPDREALAKLSLPTLVWAGSKDALAGELAPLAAMIPGARTAVVPDADHLSAVSHPAAFEAVLGFLAER